MIGISFGNYFDDEEKGEDKTGLFEFDKTSKLENSENLKGCSKNINIALKINKNYNYGNTGVHSLLNG